MQGPGKSTSKKSSRKVLADKTNVTPLAGMVPSTPPKKASVVAAAPQVKAEGKIVSPCELQLLEQIMAEDLLYPLGEELLSLLALAYNNRYQEVCVMS